MKILLTSTLSLFISFFCLAQNTTVKEKDTIPKNHPIQLSTSNETDKKFTKQEEIEKLKQASAAPAIFYIINDKAVSREEYMLYLSEQEKKKEKNPKQ